MERVSSQLRDQETVAEMSMGEEERGKALEQEEQRTYNGPVGRICLHFLRRGDDNLKKQKAPL